MRKNNSIPVDWQTYRKVFPDRYLRSSPFDSLIKARLNVLTYRLKADECLQVLDIGGGVEGSPVLNIPGVSAWLCDPYVQEAPRWMEGKVTLEEASPATFDFILCRGSFNYLSEEEIKRIPQLLRQGESTRELWFNTFLRPSTGERPYTNSLSGTAGRERFTFNERKNIIEHELLPEGSSIPVAHWFYVYSLDRIIELLGDETISVTFTGRNSLAICWKWKVEGEVSSFVASSSI